LIHPSNFISLGFDGLVGSHFEGTDLVPKLKVFRRQILLQGISLALCLILEFRQGTQIGTHGGEEGVTLFQCQLIISVALLQLHFQLGDFVLEL